MQNRFTKSKSMEMFSVKIILILSTVSVLEPVTDPWGDSDDHNVNTVTHMVALLPNLACKTCIKWGRRVGGVRGG